MPTITRIANGRAARFLMFGSSPLRWPAVRSATCRDGGTMTPPRNRATTDRRLNDNVRVLPPGPSPANPSRSRRLTAERFLYRGNELLQRKWFWQETVLSRFRQMFLECILGVAGHENDFQVWIANAQFARQCWAVHFRHHHVGDDDIDRPVRFLQHLDRLDTVTRLEHGKAARREPAGIKPAQSFLIFDQEDRALAG